MRKTAVFLVLAGFIGLGLTVPKISFGADEVDKEIQTLRARLSQLEQQQIDLKKEATAAAAAMPSFSYRPGNGLMIEAADKSWSFRTSVESHFRYNFLSGRDQVGRSQGELEGRRFRPYFYYCLNNCLWEIEAALDLDGAGGGNGKNATATGVGSILQRGAVRLNLDNINPWMPSVQFGMEVQNAQGGSLARQGSGSTGAQAEYDLHTANNGFNTGRAGSGMVFNWDDKPLKSIGIPGKIRRFQFGMSSIAEGDDGRMSFTDRKDFNIYGSIQPMADLKNKWLRGITFEFGSWFCNVDGRNLGATPGATDNGCERYRVRDNARIGRQTLFDTGSNSIGDGLHTALGPGLVWSVGPYTFRAMGHFQQSADKGGLIGKKRANSFLIGHDLYIWSPKGFLTGSSSTAGSILIGTHFERVDMSCGDRMRVCSTSPQGSGTVSSSGSAISSINGGDFHRVRVLLREWDIWYYIAPRMSMGVSVLWYDSSNLQSGRNKTAHNLGVCSTNEIAAGGCRRGIGGDWTDVFLNWRYTF